MKNLLRLIPGVFVVIFIACSKEVSDKNEDEQTKETTVRNDSSDYSWDTTNVVSINLSGNSISANSSAVIVTGNTATIASSGTYAIGGTLTDGSIIVNTSDKEKVVLILNNANIRSSLGSPISIEKAEKVIVYLPDSSENSLTDPATYTYTTAEVNEPNAAFYSKSDLTIFGNGSLNVKGNYKDGITSKDGFIISSGNITVSAVDDGIRGKDYLIINDGKISLATGGDGLKSDNEENTALGYISIVSGKIDIVSGGDAIAAQTSISIKNGEFNLTSGGGSTKTIAQTLSAKGIKGLDNVLIDGGTYIINSADDGIHANKDITINNGTFTISSADDGIHADSKFLIYDGNITIAKSYEGIEAGLITVNSGNITINASDDGFNSSYGIGGETNDNSCLTVNDGDIFVNASGGDGLDSNGNIIITGGTIIVDGPQSQPEVGMDYNGTCKISGGFLIISGTNSNMTQAPSSSSTQYSLKLILTSSLAANTLFHIQDVNGNNIVTFRPVRSFYSIVFSSQELESGATYYILTGGSSTGINKNGLFLDGIYTPGSNYSNFTISGIVTSIGSGTSGGGAPGRP